MDIVTWAHENNSDYEFIFKIDKKIKFDKLIGNQDIQFTTENNYFIGFVIFGKNLENFDAHHKLNDKAKILTNLLSVISGEHIYAYLNTIVTKTPLGESRASVMDIDNPDLPKQKLFLDLKNPENQEIFKNKLLKTTFHHLANALYNSYKNPESAIRELILAYGDTKNLPDEYKKYGYLRNSLSHSVLKLKSFIKTTKLFPRLKFDKNRSLEKNYSNRQYLVHDNFTFLHLAIKEFRNLTVKPIK